MQASQTPLGDRRRRRRDRIIVVPRQPNLILIFFALLIGLTLGLAAD